MPADSLLREAFSGGPLDGVNLNNSLNSLHLRDHVCLLNSLGTLAQSDYTYDDASRLATASDGVNNATYTYLTNSSQAAQIDFRENSTLRMSTFKQYDGLDRLTGIVSSNGAAGVVSSHGYLYNSVTQRTNAALADGAYWVYGCDSLGQVTSGKKYWSDGTPLAGQQFEYSFDDIGNRKTAASGGNEWGTNLRYENYTANNLNQYTLRTVPGYVDVLGAAAANGEVAVWSTDGPTSTYRRGECFRGEKRADNTAGPVWLGLTNIGMLRGAGQSEPHVRA